MTEATQSGGGAKRYHVGDVTVLQLPEEPTFPLRQADFQILCEGEISDAKARFYMYAGLSFGALVGIYGSACGYRLEHGLGTGSPVDVYGLHRAARCPGGRSGDWGFERESVLCSDVKKFSLFPP